MFRPVTNDPEIKILKKRARFYRVRNKSILTYKVVLRNFYQLKQQIIRPYSFEYIKMLDTERLLKKKHFGKPFNNITVKLINA